MFVTFKQNMNCDKSEVRTVSKCNLEIIENNSDLRKGNLQQNGSQMMKNILRINCLMGYEDNCVTFTTFVSIISCLPQHFHDECRSQNDRETF